MFLIRILRMIYGPSNDNGVWRTGYRSELYTVWNKTDLVEVVRIGRLRVAGTTL